MGYNIEEMQERNQLLIKTRAKSPYVCLCGHPVSSHTQTDEGDSYCKPSRMFCHCANINPVLKSEDNRNFYCKTNSYGAEHALTRGILTAMNRNKKVEWVEDRFFCMREGCTVKGAGNGIQQGTFSATKAILEPVMLPGPACQEVPVSGRLRDAQASTSVLLHSLVG